MSLKIAPSACAAHSQISSMMPRNIEKGNPRTLPDGMASATSVKLSVF